MGEKIKDINKIKIKNSNFMIELNKGTHKTGRYDIHIQNDSFRLNMNEEDFLKMALSALYAKENLDTYKGGEE